MFPLFAKHANLPKMYLPVVTFQNELFYVIGSCSRNATRFQETFNRYKTLLSMLACIFNSICSTVRYYGPFVTYGLAIMHHACTTLWVYVDNEYVVEYLMSYEALPDGGCM